MAARGTGRRFFFRVVVAVDAAAAAAAASSSGGGEAEGDAELIARLTQSESYRTSYANWAYY